MLRLPHSLHSLRIVLLSLAFIAPLLGGGSCPGPVDGGDGDGDADGGDGDGDGDGDAGIVVTDGGAPPHVAPGDLVLNEVHCQGGDDWVEVMNVSAGPLDLSSTSITDDVTDPSRRELLAGSIGPGQLAAIDVVRFGLACDTDTVTLRSADVVLDEVALRPLPEGATLGRLPDGAPDFGDTAPTRGAPNTPWLDPREVFFDPLAPVLLVRLELSDLSSSILATQEMFGPRPYAEAMFSVVDEDGEASAPQPVGVRLKGQLGSFRPWGQGLKSGLRIDFNHFNPGGSFSGMGKIALNNLVQDPTQIHEWAAYELFRRLGVAAPRVRHALLEVNGEAYGTYLLVEGLDGGFFDAHFATTAAVYEGGYGQDLDNTPASAFDLDEGTSVAPLQMAMNTLAAAPVGEGFMEASASVVDWDQVLTVMATEVFLAHWDGYAPFRNNYFFHLDEGGVLRLLPWGVDQTFGSPWPYYFGEGFLFERCLGDPVCRTAYDFRLLDVAAEAEAMRMEITDPIAALGELLHALALVDPRLETPAEEVALGPAAVLAFLDAQVLDFTTGPVSCVLTAEDFDEDGAVCSSDCAEDDPTVHVGADDSCPGGATDGVDQNCDGLADNGLDCPDCIPTEYEGRRYFTCYGLRTFAQAEAQCEVLGSRLVVLDSDEEATFVHDRMLSVSYTEYWIGLDDRDTEGEFAWADGTPAAGGYLRWSDGEPNGVGEEDCVHVWTFNGAWNDLACDTDLAAVCEDPP